MANNYRPLSIVGENPLFKKNNGCTAEKGSAQNRVEKNDYLVVNCLPFIYWDRLPSFLAFVSNKSIWI